MSIADKITSIEGHLTDDYEGLENIGADLTNVNKNIQNIRTCLDNIYESLPKTTGEGSNLSLTTLKGRINVDDILGDTQQDKTNGYQLLNVTDKASTTDSGITYSIENGIITFNGTCTKGVSLPISSAPPTLEVGSVYSVQIVEVSGTATINTSVQSNAFKFIYYASGRTNGNYVTYTNSNIGTFTAVEPDTNGSRFWLGFNNGAFCTFNNYKFKVYVVKGNYTSSTIPLYEPYTNGASPNPSYPQEIEVVTGTQEVVVQNRNLFNKDTITESQRIDPSGNKNYDENCDLSDYIKIQPNTTYTRNITASVYECIAFYTSEKVFISRDTTHSTTTSPNNAYYVRLSCYKTNLDTLQFELGSTATSYVEHQEQTKTLHLGDIELAKIGTYQDRIFETSGKQLFDKSNSSQILNAFLNGSGRTIQSNSNARTLYIPIKPSTTYTISKTLSARFIVGTFESYEIGSTTTNMITATTSESAEITSRSNDNYLCVFYYLSIADTLSEETIRNSIMINEGSTALPYEPYGSDKWYIEKNIGKYAINGASGTLTKPSTNRFNIDGALTDYLKSNNTITCLADRYVSYEQKPTNSDFNTLVANVNYGIELSSSNTAFTIRIKDTNYDDIDQYKTWLASNNVELLYVLATPTYTEITNTNLLNELNEIEKMMSYNGQTNISVSGNLPMILNVSALKGE